VGANLRDWHRIVASLQEVNLREEMDVFVWGLNASGSFTVKSMYAALINNGIRVSQDIWQIKVPMKIKVFLWYLKKGVVLTRITWLDVTGMVIENVVSVILRKPFNTFFLIVFMLNSCGALYIFFLEFRRLVIWMTFSLDGLNC